MKRILPHKRFTLVLTVMAVFWVGTMFSSGDGQESTSPDSIPVQDSAAVSAMHEMPATHEAADENAGGGEESSGHGSKEVSDVLLGLIVILLAAKVGGDLVERFKQPAVLGELIIGIVIGNLSLVGVDSFEIFKHSVTLEVLAEIGVIILLFEVGLESTIKEMMQVGLASFMVATLGVVAPFFLGWGVSAIFLPEESIYVHIFIGATLTATSVGITARVLRDINKSTIKEAKIILGAAVIDDIMGLVILAVVTGVISAANAAASGNGSGGLSSLGIFFIIAKAVAFVIGALIIGNLMSPLIFRIGSKMHVKGILLSIALLICFTLAYLAGLIGLAPIVGAFAAGLILENVHYTPYRAWSGDSLEELIEPISTFLVPIFFVRMGMMVQLETFADVDILAFAAVMTIAAIVGKQACGLAIFEKGVNRIAIGLGMIPRGEVGLIFAGIGAKLVYKGHDVISSGTFSAVVIMVIVTTLVTPPFLKWSLLRGQQEPAPAVERVED